MSLRLVRRSRTTVLLLPERWSLLRLLDQSSSTIFRFGGVGCTERTGGIWKALHLLLREENSIQSFRSRGTTRWHMPNGRVNGYPRKLSGNSPPAAGWTQSDTSGVTTSSQAVNTWRTPGKDCSRFKTVAKMDLLALRRWAPSRRMGTACTTWPATFGSGVATGIGSIATLRPQAKTVVAIPVARLRGMIQPIRTLPSASSKVVHSFATPPTAKVIAPARVEERRPTPVRPIQAFGA